MVGADDAAVGKEERRALEARVAACRKQLSEAEAELAAFTAQQQSQPSAPGTNSNECDDDDDDAGNEKNRSSDVPRLFGVGRMTKDDVERYSRQMLLPDVGAHGTAKLLAAHVVVIGAGGLGSTVALYLAAAGVGTLTLVDFDVVERSNLHRQVIHNDFRCGIAKVKSAQQSCLALNPTITVNAIEQRLDVHNAEKLVSVADVVVDASDNVAARYLINDACVMQGKPLVSGSAMRWDGQLTVYNYRHHKNVLKGGGVAAGKEEGGGVGGGGGPCYRCLFPNPPPAAAVGSCSDSGVVGAVPGMIGCLQALETQKVIMATSSNHHHHGSNHDNKHGGVEVMSGRMLIFNGLAGTHRVVKLRPRQSSCVMCGPESTVTSLVTAHVSEGRFPEYSVASCAAASSAAAAAQLPSNARTAVASLLHLPNTTSTTATCSSVGAPIGDAIANVSVVWLDVRDTPQFQMCNLQDSSSSFIISAGCCGSDGSQQQNQQRGVVLHWPLAEIQRRFNTATRTAEKQQKKQQEETASGALQNGGDETPSSVDDGASAVRRELLDRLQAAIKIGSNSSSATSSSSSSSMSDKVKVLVAVICRRGFASVDATKILVKAFPATASGTSPPAAAASSDGDTLTHQWYVLRDADCSPSPTVVGSSSSSSNATRSISAVKVVNVDGGLVSWAKTADPGFPVY